MITRELWNLFRRQRSNVNAIALDSNVGEKSIYNYLSLRPNPFFLHKYKIDFVNIYMYHIFQK